MKVIAQVLATALLTLGSARAEDACRADVEKLCAGVMQGDGRVLTCLHANEAQLSKPCKQLVGAIGTKAREIGTACGDDVMQLCPDVRMGGGRILKCLASNGPKLSPACQKVVQQTEEKTTEFKKACGDDATKFCKGVQRGQGRLLACLLEKEKELTPECQAMLKPLSGEPGAAAVPAAAPAAAPAAGAATAPAATPEAAKPAPQPGAAPAAAPATPPAQGEKKK